MKPEERESGLARVVADLCDANASTLAAHLAGGGGLPSREALQEMMLELRGALFPAHYAPTDVTLDTAHYHVGALLDAALRTLEEHVRRAFAFVAGGDPAARAAAIVRTFASRLPAVRALLETDVRAAYEGDPAATSADEAILC